MVVVCSQGEPSKKTKKEQNTNYKALATLQQKYAKQPVRFFLFPCNQFMSQEPNANSVIKTFAEKYLTLGTNVIMLSKTNHLKLICYSFCNDIS